MKRGYISETAYSYCLAEEGAIKWLPHRNVYMRRNDVSFIGVNYCRRVLL
jgi:hypothetical protein